MRRRTFTGTLVSSVVGIVLGVCGIVVAQSLKLDAEKVLTGGAYLKPAAYNVLMLVSVLLVVGGVLGFAYATVMRSRN